LLACLFYLLGALRLRYTCAKMMRWNEGEGLGWDGVTDRRTETGKSVL
jgi:hypothetical protein